MRTLWQDVRYGFRMLRKNPGFAAVAALSLALGIGANTAIFSLIDEVVLKKVPVKDPEQLVCVRRTLPGGGTSSHYSYSTYEQLRDRNQTLAGMFASDESRLSATVDGQPEIIRGAMVSGSYFRSLGSGRSRFHLGKTLVASQMVLSLLLLIGAGLFIRTFWKLNQVDLGYERDHVLLVWAVPTLIGYEGAKEIHLYQELLDRLNAIPGVRSASLSRMSLLFGYWSRGVSVPGHTPRPGEKMEVSYNAIGPRFFETMGIPLLVGRDFSAADGPTAPKVAIVGEETARRYFPGGNPIGRRLHFEDSEGSGDVDIVGVARDIKIVSVRQDPRFSTRAVYIPIGQAPPAMLGQAQFKIRTAGDPKKITETVRRELLAVERNLPLSDIGTQAELVDESLGHERSLAMLLSFFGAVALLLASIGFYGTISYAVSRRTSEIGIRMALGARNRDVLWMVLRESLLLVLIGVAIGVPAALAAGRLVAALLFGISPTDPPTLVIATLVLMAVAALAAYLPARRASQLDPMTALRYE